METEEKYEDLALDLIGQSAILTNADMSIIKDLKDELKDNFIHSQVFRTRTEMEISVLNDLKFPTPDAKYWQSQREQHVHFHELVMLSYEYRKNLVEIKKLDKKIEGEKDPLEREILQIEIERRLYISKNQERIAKDRIREIRSWSEIKADLIPKMEHGLVDCNEHQLASYTRRWITQYLAMGSNGSPAERQNIMGQMTSGLRACIRMGIIGKVINDLKPNIRKTIAEQFGVPLGIDGKVLPKFEG